MKRLLTMDDAAEYLSMSVGFIEKEIREDRIEVLHLGRVRRIDIQELDRYIMVRRLQNCVAKTNCSDDFPS